MKEGSCRWVHDLQRVNKCSSCKAYMATLIIQPPILNEGDTEHHATLKVISTISSPGNANEGIRYIVPDAKL
ncbi:hypothetical protein CRYUN_Cryun33cG0100300 [Craigia yunnanensis]